MKGSLQRLAFKGIGIPGKAVGKALARVLILSRGPVGKALIATGEKTK